VLLFKAPPACQIGLKFKKTSFLGCGRRRKLVEISLILKPTTPGAPPPLSEKRRKEKRYWTRT